MGLCYESVLCALLKFCVSDSFRRFPTVSDSFGRLEPESKYETSWNTENIIIFSDSKMTMDIMVASSLPGGRYRDLMAVFLVFSISPRLQFESAKLSETVGNCPKLSEAPRKLFEISSGSQKLGQTKVRVVSGWSRPMP